MSKIFYSALALMASSGIAGLALTKEPEAAKADARNASYALIMLVEVNGGTEGFELAHGMSAKDCKDEADGALSGPVYRNNGIYASATVVCEMEGGE